MKSKVTRTEIAAAIGVNAQTVSRAFGGFGYISKELKAIVLKKAAELGYEVHHVVRQRQNSKWRQLIPEIRRLKQSGLSYQAIGDIYGVTRQMIQQLLPVKRGEQCQRCGATDRKLNGHHLDYITDEFETLCVPCHRKAHSVAPLKDAIQATFTPLFSGKDTDNTCA